MAKYEKPRPIVLPIERPYWEHLVRHELRLQRCVPCGIFRFPASPVCAECGGDDYEWTQVSGMGEVFSWVIFHKAYFPSFAAEVPYNVAMVRLKEGPMFIANVVRVANVDIRRGMKVRVVFDDVEDGLTIPRFEPAE